MSRKEWLVVIIVIGLGVVWQIPRHDDAMPADGEPHLHAPVETRGAEVEGAPGTIDTGEEAGPYRTIELEVTGMT